MKTMRDYDHVNALNYRRHALLSVIVSPILGVITSLLIYLTFSMLISDDSNNLLPITLSTLFTVLSVIILLRMPVFTMDRATDELARRVVHHTTHGAYCFGVASGFAFWPWAL